MTFTRMPCKGVDVLIVDGSSINVEALNAGAKGAVNEFIKFLKGVGTAIDAFEAGSRPGSKMVALWGFGPLVERAGGAGGPLMFDELLSLRHDLREALIVSSIWKVPSIFFGHGDCASPVMEIIRMCRMRIWLDPAAVFRGSPGHWAFALMGVDPFNGASPKNGAVMAPWEISVEGAQKIGFLDGCLESDPLGHSIPALIERFAPLLQGRVRSDSDDSRRSGELGFRDLLVRNRQKCGRLAEGSSRNLREAMAKDPADLASAELATVYLGLNRKYEMEALPTKSANADSPVFAPQVFGAVVDLSEGILAPGFLMELARRRGFVFLTSTQTSQLPARLQAQKTSLSMKLGVNKAQAFWDRNVIPCGAGSMDPARILLPLIRAGVSPESVTIYIPGEGHWGLDLLPALAEPTVSSFAGFRMMPGVIRSSDSDWPSCDEDRWLEARPGLTEILRVFTGGVIFSREFNPAGFRSLFHHLLGYHAVNSGWPLEDVWKELSANGWSMDAMSAVRKTLDLAGINGIRLPERERRLAHPLPAIKIHARALVDWMAEAMGQDSYAKELLSGLAGIPVSLMVALTGDDKPPLGRPIQFFSEAPAPFFALSPWRGTAVRAGCWGTGLEIPGEAVRKKRLEEHFAASVLQMPQRFIDAVSKTTQIPSEVWVSAFQKKTEVR